MEDPGLVSTKVAAKIMGTEPRTMDNWRSLGRGPAYIKLNNRNVRYALADLLDYIQKHRVEPGGSHD